MRCIVIPATQAIYLQAMREGLLEIFIEAGAVVSTPTCGPCLAVIWAFWRPVKDVFPLQTAISLAVWAMWIQKYIWQARR